MAEIEQTHTCNCVIRRNLRIFHIKIINCSAYIENLNNYVIKKEDNHICPLENTNITNFYLENFVSNKTLNYINTYIRKKGIVIEEDSILFKIYRMVVIIYDTIHKVYDDILSEDMLKDSLILTKFIFKFIEIWDPCCCENNCVCDEKISAFNICPSHCSLSGDDHLIMCHFNDFLEMLSFIENIDESESESETNEDIYTKDPNYLKIFEYVKKEYLDVDNIMYEFKNIRDEVLDNF